MSAEEGSEQSPSLIDQGSAALRGLRDSAVGRKTSDLVGAAAQKTVDVGKQAIDAATFRRFRDDIETTLAKVVEVLAAQDAEVIALRRRVAELEDRTTDS